MKRKTEFYKSRLQSVNKEVNQIEAFLLEMNAKEPFPATKLPEYLSQQKL